MGGREFGTEGNESVEKNARLTLLVKAETRREGRKKERTKERERQRAKNKKREKEGKRQLRKHRHLAPPRYYLENDEKVQDTEFLYKDRDYRARASIHLDIIINYYINFVGIIMYSLVM
ncbi:hypothetical protein PUN28_003831 [Cardiocondyla obscurior]|uniref:Uncharacterized protein n=1 Tax=Cardiocondyla obscurior TaxID=286306 RepID=A0AAW2GN63_9HYME